MQITKYPQSNFLIEKDKTRILIDPGFLTFEKFETSDFGKLDAILISHQHPDHLGVEPLKYWYENGIPIYGNSDVIDVLAKNNILAKQIKSGDEFEIGAIKIKAIDIPHCNLLFCIKCGEKITADRITFDKRCSLHPEIAPTTTEGPPNTGFFINDIFFHSGDGIKMKSQQTAENAAIPITGPTINFDNAWELAESLKTKRIIPMHYSHPRFLADPVEFATQGRPGVEVRILADGESLILEN